MQLQDIVLISDVNSVWSFQHVSFSIISPVGFFGCAFPIDMHRSWWGVASKCRDQEEQRPNMKTFSILVAADISPPKPIICIGGGTLLASGG